MVVGPPDGITFLRKQEEVDIDSLNPESTASTEFQVVRADHTGRPTEPLRNQGMSEEARKAIMKQKQAERANKKFKFYKTPTPIWAVGRKSPGGRSAMMQFLTYYILYQRQNIIYEP